MRVVAVAVAAAMLLLACARPSPNELHAKSDPIDASPVVPEAGPSPAPSPVPSELPQTPTPWMVVCQRELDTAMDAAVKHSPAMAGMKVEPHIFIDGNGAHVEELSLSRLGFFLHVAKRHPHETGDDGWKMRAESLKGAYHLSNHRLGPKGSAFITFDGIPMNAAVELAPIFRSAVDRCL